MGKVKQYLFHWRQKVEKKVYDACLFDTLQGYPFDFYFLQRYQEVWKTLPPQPRKILIAFYQTSKNKKKAYRALQRYIYQQIKEQFPTP
jgi:hypothetical protein